MVARSVGANQVLTGQFETAEGSVASGNYITFRGYRFSGFDGAQPRDRRDLLGAGREPAGSYLGAFDVAPSIEGPADFRLLGYWLKLATGAAQTAVTLGSRGYIRFSAQPAAESTITLAGAAFTFKSSGATGDEANIGADLQATLDNAVTALNLSATGAIAAATYTRRGNDLVIEHDTADDTGDAFTLAASAASNGTVSAATLYGGGLKSHEFRSGSATLPSMTFQRDDPALTGGDRYTITTGVRIDEITFRRERTGPGTFTFTGRGINAYRDSSSVAGTPTVPTVNTFSNFQGTLLVDDVVVANVTSIDVTYRNGLLVADNLVENGLIEGTDPGSIQIDVNIGARESNNALRQAVDAGTPIALKMGWLDKTTGTEIELAFPVIYLPIPDISFDGPGYADLSFTGIGETNGTRSMTVTLINDVTSYT